MLASISTIFKLNYENPNNLVAVLRPLISPNNTINANPGNNTLVITDSAELPSPRRCTSAAMSLAMAYCKGTTSTSEAAGWSSAAMILPSRARLSA